MSDIVTIRRQIRRVPSTLRQGKMVPAVNAVVEGLRCMLTTQMLKAEKDEFTGAIREAVDYLNSDRKLRELYPLEIEYSAGDEKKALTQMVELLTIVNEAILQITKRVGEKKQVSLDEGQGYLDVQEYDKARKVFRDIATEFSDDDALKGQIGEKVLAAGLYEDAIKYFEDALSLNPKALHHYNRLAISLRKLGRFELAEEKYHAALPLAPEDPYLLFNLGRLYAEWGKWDKAFEFGQKAFALNPDFTEAQKLANFAQKRM